MKRYFFLCFLAFAHSLSAQNMIQMQQLPLLTSPSFTGSDTTGRVILAMQRFGDNSGDDQRKTDYNTEAYYASFDTRNTTKTKAFGGYISYSKTAGAYRQKLESYDRYPKPALLVKTDKHEDKRLEKLEAGVSYVPVFWKFSSKTNRYDLIPALFVSYSHHATQISLLDYKVNEDSVYTLPIYPPLLNDTVKAAKSVKFDRVSLGGSLLLRRERLFLSYQFAVRYDQVAMDVADYHSRSDEQSEYTLETFQTKYKKGYLQIANYVAFGAYYPARPNSLIQFNPIIVVSYMFSPVNGHSEPLSLEETSYRDSRYWYDYGDFFGPALRRLSLNIRVWKFLGGCNLGTDRYMGSIHYYLGYKTPKLTVTAGIANSSVFNASLQYNFR